MVHTSQDWRTPEAHQKRERSGNFTAANSIQGCVSMPHADYCLSSSQFKTNSSRKLVCKAPFDLLALPSGTHGELESMMPFTPGIYAPLTTKYSFHVTLQGGSWHVVPLCH